MAPLKLSEEQVVALNSNQQVEESKEQSLELHPEAYKVSGPAPEKMKTVSSSLRTYASGLYGLL